MSTTRDLIDALKAELKSAGLTYADVAEHLHMAESSVKRMFALGDMPLSRVDEVLRLLKLDFTELARRVAGVHRGHAQFAHPLHERIASVERIHRAQLRLHWR